MEVPQPIRSRLADMAGDYGEFKQVARRARVGVSTLWRAITKGVASERTINRLRDLVARETPQDAALEAAETPGEVK